jgi:hypothetical protein
MKKADEIIDSAARYFRNGGWEEICRGNFVRLQLALDQLTKLRATALSQAEYESYEQKIRLALKKAGTDRKVQYQRASTVDVHDWKRRMRVGQIYRPCISNP